MNLTGKHERLSIEATNSDGDTRIVEMIDLDGLLQSVDPSEYIKQAVHDALQAPMICTVRARGENTRQVVYKETIL